MRVYLPATLSSLSQAVQAAEYGPAPLTGFAVTSALRSWYSRTGADVPAGDATEDTVLEDSVPEDTVLEDTDELEYAAFTQATRGSLRLLDADPLAPRRRVVISVDVADDLVTAHPDLDRAVVRVRQPVPVRWWACVHVDDTEAQETVSAAARAVIAADLADTDLGDTGFGDTDAQFTVDAALGHELAWYDASEVETLIESVRG